MWAARRALSRHHPLSFIFRPFTIFGDRAIRKWQGVVGGLIGSLVVWKFGSLACLVGVDAVAPYWPVLTRTMVSVPAVYQNMLPRHGGMEAWRHVGSLLSIHSKAFPTHGKKRMVGKYIAEKHTCICPVQQHALQNASSSQAQHDDGWQVRLQVKTIDSQSDGLVYQRLACAIALNLIR